MSSHTWFTWRGGFISCRIQLTATAKWAGFPNFLFLTHRENLSFSAQKRFIGGALIIFMRHIFNCMDKKCYLDAKNSNRYLGIAWL